MLRRYLTAAAMAAVSLSLAACGDAATAPQTPAGVGDNTSPSALRLKVVAWATVRVVDIQGKLIDEHAQIRIKTFNAAFAQIDSSWVMDGFYPDVDPTPGIIRMAVTPGSSTFTLKHEQQIY